MGAEDPAAARRQARGAQGEVAAAGEQAHSEQDRGGPMGRRAGALGALGAPARPAHPAGRQQPGRGRGVAAGRVRECTDRVGAGRGPDQAGRVAAHRGPAEGDRPLPPRGDTGPQAAAAAARGTGGGRRHVDHPGRAAAAAVHLLSPGAARRGPGRAHAAAARRADHGGDRAGVPGRGADDGGPDHPGEEEDRRRRHPVPGAEPTRSCPSGWPASSRCSTWSSPRATRPPRATSRYAASSATRPSGWPGWCRADAGRAGGGRAARAAAAAARPPGRPDGPDGRLVLLPEQDRTRWDTGQITEGLALLRAAARRGPAGPYLLQAAIAAEHARRPRAADTAWDRIATLYAALEDLTGSPVVRLNRAVAVAEVDGPAAGLALLAELDGRWPASTCSRRPGPTCCAGSAGRPRRRPRTRRRSPAPATPPTATSSPAGGTS